MAPTRLLTELIKSNEATWRTVQSRKSRNSQRPKELTRAHSCVKYCKFSRSLGLIVSSSQRDCRSHDARHRLATGGRNDQEPDTIIVPAQEEGFTNVFLKENAWYAIRIAAGKIPKIKYIAGYQTQPISAITHIAPVAKIEPYGDKGKYKLVFSEPAKPIGPIPFGDAFMQGPRYTTHQKLQNAKTLTDTML